MVAFVAGASGTVASDLLAPYDIFASSPAFTTYVVADTATPAPLEGGPAVVPTYTFADVDADPALRPDLVVVPGLTEPTGAAEAPLRTWVTRQHEDGAKVLGVCSGSLVLAATGMLDGLDATSHWSRISALEKSRPAVHWLRGRRYVEDGSVTTTAAVTSGVPAALHLVAELAGPAEAQRVGEPPPGAALDPDPDDHNRRDHFAVRDWPVGLNYVMPWFRPTVGVALTDGVGELDATAAFEVYKPVRGRPHRRPRHGRHGPHPPRPGAAHHQLRPRPRPVPCRRPRRRPQPDAHRPGLPPGPRTTVDRGNRSTAGSVRPCRTSPTTPTPPPRPRPPR